MVPQLLPVPFSAPSSPQAVEGLPPACCNTEHCSLTASASPCPRLACVAVGCLRKSSLLLSEQGQPVKVIVGFCVRTRRVQARLPHPRGQPDARPPLPSSRSFCAHFLKLLLLFSLLDDISGTLPTSVLVAPMGSSLQSFPLPPPPPPHAPG